MADTKATTIVELPDNLRSPLHREGNKGLMVAWINADLLTRANHDVRRSFVFYDEDGLFEWALADLPAPKLLQRLHDELGWRYWSVGI